MALSRRQRNSPYVQNTGLRNAKDEQGRWAVHTKERGAVRARKVVIAIIAYRAGVTPQYQCQLVPVRGLSTRVVTPSGKPTPYLPITTTLQWSDWEFDYLTSKPDGGIIVGGWEDSAPG
ncbi:hypothetical protein KEM54_001743 [Ascosphaera aggregata]|nr:hypothetical protein KEM54_001743 [Ascosphaera aggregata]